MNNEENAASTTTISDTTLPATLGHSPEPHGVSITLPKSKRVGLIFAALESAPAPENREAALVLLDQVFRMVEDAHSGLPHDPPQVGRMYPPISKMQRAVPGKLWLRRYRHKNHVSLIADNGAMEMRVIQHDMVDGVDQVVGERTVFEKQGADGRRVSEVE